MKKTVSIIIEDGLLERLDALALAANRSRSGYLSELVRGAPDDYATLVSRIGDREPANVDTGRD